MQNTFLSLPNMCIALKDLQGIPRKPSGLEEAHKKRALAARQAATGVLLVDGDGAGQCQTEMSGQRICS